MSLRWCVATVLSGLCERLEALRHLPCHCWCDQNIEHRWWTAACTVQGVVKCCWWLTKYAIHETGHGPTNYYYMIYYVCNRPFNNITCVLMFLHGSQESMKSVYATVGRYSHVQDQVLASRGRSVFPEMCFLCEPARQESPWLQRCDVRPIVLIFYVNKRFSTVLIHLVTLRVFFSSKLMSHFSLAPVFFKKTIHLLIYLWGYSQMMHGFKLQVWESAAEVAKVFRIGKGEAGAILNLTTKIEPQMVAKLRDAVRVRGMRAFLNHECVAKDLFNLTFSSGTGAFEAWSSQLMNRENNELVPSCINLF